MKMFLLKIPDIMTVSRFFTAPIFAILLYRGVNDKNVEILAQAFIVFLIICSSDFFDGKIARKIGNETQRGALMDIIADVFFVTISHVVLLLSELIPIWFILLVELKFIEFAVTSKFLKKYNFVKKEFFFDFMGRVVAIIFYIMPGICLLLFALEYSQEILIDVILLITLILSIFSSVGRIRKCIRVYYLNKVRHKDSKKAF